MNGEYYKYCVCMIYPWMCPVHKTNVRKPAKQDLAIGWLCPRCGRGNSPTAQACSCGPFEMKVTC